MKLLIFKLKLLIHLGLFLLNLAFDQVKRARGFFIAMFIIFIIVSLVLIQFFKNRVENKQTPNDTSYSPTRPELYVKSSKTKQEIQLEVSYWERIIEKQPNSRDALINLSVLKNILNQPSEAQELWNKARLIDPNNPVFK